MNAEPTTTHSNRALRGIEPELDWLKLVKAQVESLKFGAVQITVHDCKVVQIERVEKTRLDRL
jgi:hypothetical protein